jgi:hypothetical protein
MPAHLEKLVGPGAKLSKKERKRLLSAAAAAAAASASSASPAAASVSAVPAGGAVRMLALHGAVGAGSGARGGSSSSQPLPVAAAPNTHFVACLRPSATSNAANGQQVVEPGALDVWSIDNAAAPVATEASSPATAAAADGSSGGAAAQQHHLDVSIQIMPRAKSAGQAAQKAVLFAQVAPACVAASTDLQWVAYAMAGGALKAVRMRTTGGRRSAKVRASGVCRVPMPVLHVAANAAATGPDSAPLAPVEDGVCIRLGSMAAAQTAEASLATPSHLQFLPLPGRDRDALLLAVCASRLHVLLCTHGDDSGSAEGDAEETPKCIYLYSLSLSTVNAVVKTSTATLAALPPALVADATAAQQPRISAAKKSSGARRGRSLTTDSAAYDADTGMEAQEPSSDEDEDVAKQTMALAVAAFLPGSSSSAAMAMASVSAAANILPPAIVTAFAAFSMSSSTAPERFLAVAATHTGRILSLRVDLRGAQLVADTNLSALIAMDIAARSRLGIDAAAKDAASAALLSASVPYLRANRGRKSTSSSAAGAAKTSMVTDEAVDFVLTGGANPCVLALTKDARVVTVPAGISGCSTSSQNLWVAALSAEVQKEWHAQCRITRATMDSPRGIVLLPTSSESNIMNRFIVLGSKSCCVASVRRAEGGPSGGVKVNIKVSGCDNLIAATPLSSSEVAIFEAPWRAFAHRLPDTVERKRYGH